MVVIVFCAIKIIVLCYPGEISTQTFNDAKPLVINKFYDKVDNNKDNLTSDIFNVCYYRYVR